MSPIYNADQDIFCLPFRQKCPVSPSIHNCIFRDSEGKDVLTLVKIKNYRYQMVFESPISPFVAYAFALTSFTFKWASE